MIVEMLAIREGPKEGTQGPRRRTKLPGAGRCSVRIPERSVRQALQIFPQQVPWKHAYLGDSVKNFIG